MRSFLVARAFLLLVAFSLPALAGAQAREAWMKGLAGIGFTYQGQLRSGGAVVSGVCDFEFSLWDSEAGGIQIGMTESEPLIPVSDGQFTVQLNYLGQFGPSAFNGQARWLEIAVRCAGEPVLALLTPRQPLSPAPYAFALPGVMPGPSLSGANQGNSAAAFSLAAGRRAKAPNTGSFVWADSTNSDFSSTEDNQVALRAANGVFIANDAGNSKVVPVGTRYRDNGVVAWARVTGIGTVDTDFNVTSVTKIGTGYYRIVLDTSLQSGFSLIAAVTPEVDTVTPDVAPVGAANVRIAVTNQVASGATFDVFMYNGSFALVDNDFHVLVVGR